MKSANQLREERAQLRAKRKAIVESAKAEKRELNLEEEKYFDSYGKSINELDGKIQRQEEIEKMEAAEETQKYNQRKANRKEKGEAAEKRALQKRFSFSRAIALAAQNKPLDGVEGEVDAIGSNEARSLGLTTEGIAIPSSFMAPEKRDLAVGTNSGADGGVAIATENSPLIEYLYPQTVLTDLGVTMMTGMTGNFDLIRQDGGVTAEWEGETDDNAKVSATYENVPMRPKRLGAYTVFSKQLMLQSSMSVENEVRMNLENAIGVALETAALNGSGTGNVPEGILNFTNALTVAIGTNGGAPTRAHLLSMIRQVLDANTMRGANDQNFAFLTTNGVWEKLSATQLDAGSGRFVWEENLLQRPSYTSNLVPGNLTKGAGTDLHAIIFGNFSQLYMGQWGGLDLVVDPYTLAIKSQIRVVANSWWDINARHEDAFAVIKDADVS